jgi:hypothetical protein
VLDTKPVYLMSIRIVKRKRKRKRKRKGKGKGKGNCSSNTKAASS